MNTARRWEKWADMSASNGWEKWADWNELQQGDLIEWLCANAGVAPGMTVLDLASGAGQPAIAAAQRVKPGGRVIATDVAADMLASTERRAKRAGVELDLREIDMHDLTAFADSSIDAVTFGYALMFSPDPVKVMSEIRRVLKHGARFSLCVWDEPAKNPYFTTLFGSLAQVAPQPAPVPGSPGPFKLAPPGELERVIRAAGFTDVTVEARLGAFAFDSLDHHWEVTCDLATPFRKAVAALPESDVTRLRELISTALAPYRTGDGVRAPITPLCATGRA